MSIKKTTRLVTIIIPAYNAEDSIFDCLNSIKNQTYSKYKVIIVDDESTDNTLTIANSFKQDNPSIEIEILKQKHSGPSKARNLALQNIDTKYISFVDADDTIEPNFLHRMITESEKHHAAITICNINFLYGKNIQRPLKIRSRTIKSQEFLESLITEFQGYTPNKLYRTDLIQKKFNDKIHFCEDLLFNLENITSDSKIRVINEYLYNYHQTTKSVTHQNFQENHLSIFLAYNQALNIISQKAPQATSIYNYHFLLNILKQYYNYKHTKDFNKTAKSQFKTYIQRNTPLIMKNKRISLQQKVKFFAYKYFYGIIYVLQKIKHHFGARHVAA